jgi:hypothetical protein
MGASLLLLLLLLLVEEAAAVVAARRRAVVGVGVVVVVAAASCHRRHRWSRLEGAMREVEAVMRRIGCAAGTGGREGIGCRAGEGASSLSSSAFPARAPSFGVCF